LIFDQVESLKALGVNVHKYTGAVKSTLNAIMRDVRSGSCHLLYTTPETFNNNTEFQMEIEALYTNNQLRGFVVDEAHCVSSWGHDFRPDYLNMNMRELYPEAPIWAFTATATKLVRSDIIRTLSMTETRVFTNSFVKDNISYRIKEKEKDSWGYIASCVYNQIVNSGNAGNTGIVYCLSRKECEYISGILQDKGLKASHYHASIEADLKDKVQKQWLTGNVKIIVATIAFALGINKPDVRYVIHTSMPKCIETYYQQTGRAGRDDLPATCTMFYSRKDYDILKGFDEGPSLIEPSFAPVTNQQRLDAMYSLCENVKDCIKIQLSNYLGEYGVQTCNINGGQICMNCMKGPKQKEMVQPVVDAIYSLLPKEKETLIDLVFLSNYVKGSRVLNKLLNDGYLSCSVNNKDDISIEVIDVIKPKPSGFFL